LFRGKKRSKNMGKKKIKKTINIMLFVIFIIEFIVIANYIISGNFRENEVINTIRLKNEVSEDKKYVMIITADINTDKNAPRILHVYADKNESDGRLERIIGIKSMSQVINSDDFKIKWDKEYVKLTILNYDGGKNISYRFYYEDM